MKRILLCGAAMLSVLSVTEVSAAGYSANGTYCGTNGNGYQNVSRYNGYQSSTYKSGTLNRYGSNGNWYVNNNYNSWPPANGNTGITGKAPCGTCVGGNCKPYSTSGSSSNHRWNSVNNNSYDRYWNAPSWNTSTWNSVRSNYRPYPY